MDKREAIFRKVVVERLSSPDQLDQLLQVLHPRSWMLLLAIGLLFATAFAWSVLGTVAVTAPASGLLLRPGGIADLAAPQRGRVASLRSVDDVLAAGETAATLALAAPAEGGSAEGAEVELTVPFAARIVEVLAVPGREVTEGTPLISFERAEEELRAVLFVESSAALQIRPGQAVWISARRGGDAGASGRLLGEVIAVASRPATARGLEALLADRELTDRLIEVGRRWRVDVRLPPEAAEAAALRASRTEVDGRIVLRKVRPLHRFLPWVQIETAVR